MDTPRILAIDDVRLQAPLSVAAKVAAFYGELIGLERVDDADPDRVVFRAYPRSGPRLIVELAEPPAPRAARREALIQVASLAALAEQLLDRRWPFEWSRGWFFFDRRLAVPDPAGNRIELVTYHPV